MEKSQKMVGSDHKYILSTIIVHYGSASGGHYVSYKRLFSEDDNKKSRLWVSADDNDI